MVLWDFSPVITIREELYYKLILSTTISRFEASAEKARTREDCIRRGAQANVIENVIEHGTSGGFQSPKAEQGMG